MTDTPRALSLASAAALLLALSQPGWATPEAAATTVEPAPEVAAPAALAAPPAETPPAAAAEAPPASEPATAEVPGAEAPAATPTSAEIARSHAEARQARRAEQDVERNQRYQDLRQRAAEVGLELPETPPWEAMPEMPEPPAMPPHMGAAAPDREAMRKEREAMREYFKTMTPEERKAMRDSHWQKMRERAAEHGMDMPETPPWEEAEKRYKAAQEQFDRYRKIVDEMTEEQLEAARALFGRSEEAPRPMQPMAPRMLPQMPQRGYGQGYGPQGGYPGYGPYQGGPGAMGPGPMPYYEGGMEQAPPPPRGALPY